MKIMLALIMLILAATQVKADQFELRWDDEDGKLHILNCPTPPDGGTAVYAPLDQTAPTISNVSSGTPGTTSATLTYTTNETSDSQVEYGTTTNYGASTTLDSCMVTYHSQQVSGLTAGVT